MKLPDIRQRETWDCGDVARDVCGNIPDEAGCLEHGRGCYVLDEDGGGAEFFEPASNPRWEALKARESELIVSRKMPWARMPSLFTADRGLVVAVEATDSCWNDSYFREIIAKHPVHTVRLRSKPRGYGLPGWE